VRSGKPITTPQATISRGKSCTRCGRGSRKTQTRRIASNPASEARRKVRKKGDISSTAMRVAGNEPLKITTPSRPLSQPASAECVGLFSAEFAILTSLSLISGSLSIDGLNGRLRHLRQSNYCHGYIR